jgi:hypothetical protein
MHNTAASMIQAFAFAVWRLLYPYWYKCWRTGFWKGCAYRMKWKEALTDVHVSNGTPNFERSGTVCCLHCVAAGLYVCGMKQSDQLVWVHVAFRLAALEHCHKVCIFDFYVGYIHRRLITVAARSKAWTVFSRSDTGIVGLNPTWGVDVCVRLFCVCAVLCAGSGLTTGWCPPKESYRLCKKIKKLKKWRRSNKGQ